MLRLVLALALCQLPVMASAMPEEAITVSCRMDAPGAGQADTDAICAAMEAELQDRGAPASDDRLDIVVAITDFRPNAIKAHVEWSVNGGAVERSETVTLGIVDAELSPRHYGQLAAALLKVGDLPI